MHGLKCLSEDYVKNGLTRKKQRYQCKKCRCNFTQQHKRGASLEKRLLALKLYLEGQGFRSIGSVLNVHNVTVLNWIRSIGKSVKSHINTHFSADLRHVDFIEIDEMWHFTVKKNENFRSGSLSIVIPKKSLASQLEPEEKKAYKELIRKIANYSTGSYCTDRWKIYNDLPKDKHLVGKKHTTQIESLNANVRHYLARFHRRTRYYSKSPFMDELSLTLLFYKHLFDCLF